jgi:HK97 family phage prohead protease
MALEFGAVPPYRFGEGGTNGDFELWRKAYAAQVIARQNSFIESAHRHEAAGVRPQRGGLVLAGIACLYDVRHLSTGPETNCMYDNFKAGCFTKFLTSSGRRTRFDRMHQHAAGRRFGDTDDGRLELCDGREGLTFKLHVDEDDPASIALFDEVRTGSLREMSVGYFPADFDFEDAGDGWKTRSITEAFLGEISAVNIGAVPRTVCRAIDERHAGRVDLRRSTSLSGFRAECSDAHVMTAFGRVRDLLERQ